ncbi:MAG: alpha-ketoacid dehydrogenase subunit beta [Christensenellales bacterium]
MRKITYAAAICEAIDEEMERDENVMIIGEDVAGVGGTWKTSVGLLDKYGAWRVRNAPISEMGFSGLAVGAAMMGARPIVEIMFCDFSTVCFDMIVNQAAKLRYMTGGMVKMPIVFRMPMGAGRSGAGNHSQSLHALYAHIPGLKVVVPSCAADAKGLLKTAIRDDNAVVFMEAKMEYAKKYPVPEGEYTIPFGKCNILRPGNDITIVAYGASANKALAAAERLAELGIDAEVVDPRTILPLDSDGIAASVRKTGRLLIVDEGTESYGISGEITYQVTKKAFGALQAPVERLCTPDIIIPFSPALEFPVLVDADKIITKVKTMLNK